MRRIAFGLMLAGAVASGATLYNGGAWTTIDNNPLNGRGAQTQGFGIKHSGRIVGAIYDPLGHGALWDGTSWTLVGNDPNDATNSTSYTGIANSGLMSGIYNSPPAGNRFSTMDRRMRT